MENVILLQNDGKCPPFAGSPAQDQLSVFSLLRVTLNETIFLSKATPPSRGTLPSATTDVRRKGLSASP